MNTTNGATLRLGHAIADLRPALHNGPGWRVAFWVQGCVHRCTDQCLSPHLLDPQGGQPVEVETLVNAIRRVVADAVHPVEGVTVLGGEPFEQAAALAAVLAPMRAEGLSAMVYSGHTLEHLRRDPAAAELLAQTDVLADGPFLPHLYSETLPWRGSSNQRLHCLTDRYTPASLVAAAARQGKGFSLQLDAGRYAVSGLQSRPAAAAVEALFGRIPLTVRGA